jgi:hypothetical protein
VSKPGDPDSLPNVKPRDVLSELINPADNLMARNHRCSVQRQIAFDDMDVRPANRTNAYSDSHFVGCRPRLV